MTVRALPTGKPDSNQLHLVFGRRLLNEAATHGDQRTREQLVLEVRGSMRQHVLACLRETSGDQMVSTIGIEEALGALSQWQETISQRPDATILWDELTSLGTLLVDVEGALVAVDAAETDVTAKRERLAQLRRNSSKAAEGLAEATDIALRGPRTRDGLAWLALGVSVSGPGLLWLNYAGLLSSWLIPVLIVVAVVAIGVVAAMIQTSVRAKSNQRLVLQARRKLEQVNVELDEAEYQVQEAKATLSQARQEVAQQIARIAGSS